MLPRHEGARIGPQITSLTRLRDEVIGARLDEELYDLMRSDEDRDRLRSVRIETYFSPETRRLVFAQGAFVYSEELLRRPEDTRVKETPPVEEAYRPAVRDGGFRRAVVTLDPQAIPPTVESHAQGAHPAAAANGR